MAKTYTPVGWEDGVVKTPAIADLSTGEVTPAQVEGITPVNAENLNHMDEAIKNLYDEGASSKDIFIGAESEAPEDTKIVIDPNQIITPQTTVPVVQTLDGNDDDKVASVKAINNQLGDFKKSSSLKSWPLNNTSDTFQLLVLNYTSSDDLYVNGTKYNANNTRIEGFSIQTDSKAVSFQFGCITYSANSALTGKIIFRYKHGTSGSGGNWTSLN